MTDIVLTKFHGVWCWHVKGSRIQMIDSEPSQLHAIQKAEQTLACPVRVVDVILGRRHTPHRKRRRHHR